MENSEDLEWKGDCVCEGGIWSQTEVNIRVFLYLNGW